MFIWKYCQMIDENIVHCPLAYNTDKEEDLKTVEYSSIQNIEEEI